MRTPLSRHFVAAVAALGCTAFGPAPATPPVMGLGLSPGAQCRAAIDRAERAYHIPPHLLAAIGRIESGRRTAEGGIDPWPYSINVAGADTIFETKAAAVAGVRALLAGGARSIDVGCLQVNLMYHPDAFASLEDAFDPWRNADYGARFLVQLHEQTGSWDTATADYHSAMPELGIPYAAKVRAALAEETGQRPFDLFVKTAPPLVTSLAAIGRPAFQMPPQAGRLRLVAGAGLGLDAYRSHPVRLAPLLFQPGLLRH